MTVAQSLTIATLLGGFCGEPAPSTSPKIQLVSKAGKVSTPFPPACEKQHFRREFPQRSEMPYAAGDRIIRVYVAVGLSGIDKGKMEQALRDGLGLWQKWGRVQFRYVNSKPQANLVCTVNYNPYRATDPNSGAWGYTLGNVCWMNRWRWENDRYIGQNLGTEANKLKLIKAIYCHECGHFLGFKHVAGLENYMNVNLSLGSLGDDLGPKDKLQLKNRYGLRPGVK